MQEKSAAVGQDKQLSHVGYWVRTNLQRVHSEAKKSARSKQVNVLVTVYSASARAGQSLWSSKSSRMPCLARLRFKMK